MKRGIVVILAILLTAGAGFLIPILMQSDKYSFMKGTAGSTTTDVKTPVAVPTSKVTDNFKLETPLVSPSPGYKTDVNLGTPNPTTMPQTTEVIAQDGKVVSSSKPVVSDGNEIEPVPQATNNNESVNWVERKIREHRDEIDDDDLADFRRIYSSVNIGYIQSLMNEGLGDEQMTQLKSYLRSTLGGDYERAKELFYEYSYLLAEV